jgi:adhesin transport system membrane fusion protein
MPIDASILTGERTVLQYLLKPVLKTLDAALQER